VTYGFAWQRFNIRCRYYFGERGDLAI